MKFHIMSKAPYSRVRMPPKIIFTTCWLVGYLLIGGCTVTTGTGSGLQSAQAPMRTSLDGIWKGEFDIGGRGPYDFIALHVRDKAYAFSRRAKTVCVGTVALEGKHYTSEYILFALDGGPFDSAVITGELTEEGEITSRFLTKRGGETGKIKLTYSPVYDLPSSFAATQGSWSYTDRDGLTTDFAIQREGVIEGHDSIGCKYVGYLEIVDPAYNAYQVKVEITSCGSVDGKYEGISFVSEERLNMHLVNQKYGLYFVFESK